MKEETSYLVRYASLILILAVCATGAQAQSRTIELKTDDGTTKETINIPLQDNTDLQLLADGNIAATAETGFICQQGDSCSDVEVSLSGIDGGLFELSDSTVTQGVDFQVTWDARGAWDCTGFGLKGTVWNSENPKMPFGSQKISTGELSVGDYTVEIVCENGPASASDALALTIEEATSDSEIAGCEDVGSLSDLSSWTRTNDAQNPWGSTDEQTFENIFNTWPGTGNNSLIGIPKNEFLAVSFNSGPLTSDSSGSLRPEDPQGVGSGDVGQDVFLVSFSQCPGDFDPNSSALADGCLQSVQPWVNNPSWGGPGSGAKCELEANTDYYLNIVYTRDAVGTLPPTQAPCDGEPRCGNQFAPRGWY